MTVESILESKRSVLDSVEYPVLDFTVEEVNALADIDSLCILKLKHKFPSDFNCSHTVMQSFYKYVNGDNSLYRILEICMLNNPATSLPICTVFPQYKACYEK